MQIFWRCGQKIDCVHFTFRYFYFELMVADQRENFLQVVYMHGFCTLMYNNLIQVFWREMYIFRHGINYSLKCWRGIHESIWNHFESTSFVSSDKSRVYSLQ